MHYTSTALAWLSAVLGVTLLGYGLAMVAARRGGHGTRPALGCFWFGLFLLIETGPRLAGWPASLVLGLSGLACVPLLLAARTVRRY
ncbi:MAG TPA: hypothetical protein VGX49_07105 [Jatrophihabitans sp.]|nr:hypothetical protein [Jatrophihabitans sp.]